MTPIRALILDFDGVVLESNDLKTRAFEAVFSRFPDHAGAMMAYHHAHVSESRFAKFRHLVANRLGRPADDPLVDELGAAFSAEMLRQIRQCPMVPGAEAFLDRVRGRLPVFLASVTPQAELEAILRARRLAGYFTKVYGCPPWSKPGAIADILAGLGGGRHVVFVGDSAGDQRAAIETGVEFIARDSGLPFDAPPPQAYPDLACLLDAIANRLPLPEKGSP